MLNFRAIHLTTKVASVLALFNKILHKKDISLSEDEEKLINTLKILFKNEFLKEYWCKSRIFNNCFNEKNEQSKD